MLSNRHRRAIGQFLVAVIVGSTLVSWGGDTTLATPPSPEAIESPSWFTPLVPARLLDTRPGQSTIDGQGLPGVPLGPNRSLELVVAGRGGVPGNDVAAVVLNVTATGPTTASFLTVWPTGTGRPSASNLNMVPGQTVPNLVVAKMGTGGRVSIFNRAGSVDLVVDVAGYVPATDGFEPLVPVRLLETRPGLDTIDGQGRPGRPIGADGRIELRVLGRGGVPASGVDAVVLNITATNATATSFVTVWPSGVDRPIASNLNTAAGETVANLVVAKVGVDGRVAIFNKVGSVDVIADIAGYFPTGGTFVPVQPARLFETRPDQSVTVGGSNKGTPFGELDQFEFPVLGVGGVPASGVSAVVLNVTAINSAAPSFLTVWPYGTDRPTASNLNMRGSGHTVPNLVIAKVGAGGKVSIFNRNGLVDVVVDVAGYFREEPAGLRSVDAAGQGTCALDTLGRVSCWGTNAQDDAAFDSLVDPFSRFRPYRLGTFGDVVDVALGFTHSCVLRVDRTVWCWGGGGVLPLIGDGTSDARWPAIQVPGIANVVDIDSEEFNTCALRSNGTVWCWGAGFGAGELPVPTQIAGLSNIEQVEVSSNHACARRGDGRVLCWGQLGSTGVLGDGSGTDSATPRLVAGLTDAASIHIQSLRGCAVRGNGEAVCWGNSMLGAGETGRSLTPVTVVDAIEREPVTDITQIAGGDDWVCAVRSDRKVYCWGSESSASFGLAPASSFDLTRISDPVQDLPGVASIATGRFHICAATVDADLYCWGINQSGQVGDGTVEVRPSPTLITDL